MGRAVRRCALAIICLCALPSDLRAERLIRLDPLRAELISEYEGTWRRAGSATSTRELEAETRLRLRQTGVIIDRRIGTFAVQIEPTHSVARLSGSEQPENTQTVNLNYSIAASALQGTPGPVGFTGDFSRSTGTSRGDLGTQRDFDLLQGSISANWKTSIFPSTLRFSQRAEESEFRSAFSTVPTKRDEVLRSLSYTGRSRKLNVLLEHEWFDDRRETVAGDRVQDRANIRHRFLWGKGSSLFSNLVFFDRRGFNPSRSLRLNETADIKHTNNLDSTTSYRFNFDQQDTTAIGHAGTFGLRHRLYSNLTTRLSLNGARQESDVADQNIYGANLGLDYRKKIPWDGTFTAGVQSGYSISDRRSQGGEERVVDESHVVPAVLVVALNQRFIASMTVIVTSAGCAVVCVQGVDYNVVRVANNVTEIRVIFGGAIAAGDTILASYAFQVQPSARFSTLTTRYNAGLDFGWVAVFHSQTRSSDTAISGAADEFLNDTQDIRTRLVFRWRGDDIRATLSAEDRFIKSGNSKTDSLEIAETLSYKITPRLNFNAGASQIFSQSAGREAISLSAGASASWFPISNLVISPRVKFSSLSERGDVAFGGNREDRFLEAGFDVRWRWRRIAVVLDYRHNVRTGLDVERTEDRVFLRFVRRL